MGKSNSKDKTPRDSVKENLSKKISSNTTVSTDQQIAHGKTTYTTTTFRTFTTKQIRQTNALSLTTFPSSASYQTPTISDKIAKFDGLATSAPNLRRDTNVSPNRLKVDAKPLNLAYVSPYRKTSVQLPSSPSPTPITRNSPSHSSLVKPQTSSQSQRKTSLPVQSLNNNKKLRSAIVVKKTFKFYDRSTKVPTYKTSSKNRGYALVINNIKFHEEKSDRKGAEKDGEHIRSLFQQIGFKVTNHKNAKTSDIRKYVKDFAQNKNLMTGDISLVVIMSHGTNNKIGGGYTEILGVDGKTIPIDEVLMYFDSETTPHLKGKPKIFIFQCCRGETEVLLKDAVPLHRPLADMLIAYSTVPGFVSYRHPEEGTYYIRTICEVFSEHAHEYDIETLLVMVDEKLSKLLSGKQTSSYENRGFKKCYLHPV